MKVIEGTLFFPNDPGENDSSEWVWTIPLLEDDDMPDGLNAEIQSRGLALDDCIVRMTKGLRILGFVGRAYMSNSTWRTAYGVLEIHSDGSATTDMNPTTQLEIEEAENR